MTSIPTQAGSVTSATYPAAVKARYIGAHQASFGSGLALGPVFGVVVWEGLHRGVWWLRGLLGLISAALALYAMSPGEAPAQVTTDALP